MKFLQRTTRVLATAAIASLALAACTPSTSSSGSNSGSGGAGSTELTVWHYFSVDGQTAGLDSLASSFEVENDGVTVTNVYVPFDQLTNKLVQAAGTSSGPDVVVFNAADTFTLKEAGAIESMQPWWDTYADADQFPDAVIQKIDDEVYGIQGFVNLLGLWYNQDMLDEIGAEVPTSIEDLEGAMDKAVAAGHAGITLTGKANSEGEWQGFPWLTANGWDYAAPELSALESTFSMIQDWTSKKYLTKEASTWDQTIPFQEFAAGNSAFAVNGNWQITSAENDAKFNYGVVPLPLGDGVVYLGGEAQNVGAFSENKDLAMKYLEHSFFSADGELVLLDSFGSIPARADAAADEKVSSDPILSKFAEIVNTSGHPSPDRAIPTENVAKVLQAVGEHWSAAIAGNGTSEEIAADLFSELEVLLKK